MVDNEKIIGIARLRPIQPADVAKVAGVDTIVAGAILSDLASKKLLKVSNLKVGSSPLYYYPSNPGQLLRFVDYLNEKDKETVDILKEKKIMRPSQESPLIRVSLNNIKDFAIPLEVTIDNNKEIFYKWFLLKDDEVKPLIEQMLGQKKSSEKRPERVEKQESPVMKEKKLIPKKEEKKFVEKVKTYNIDGFFEKNKIKVLNILDKKKKSACEYIIKLPTPVGNVKFFCAVLNKCRVSDADISKVIVKSQMRKLPGLLLYCGQLTNKAQELSKSNSEILIKRLD